MKIESHTNLLEQKKPHMEFGMCYGPHVVGAKKCTYTTRPFYRCGLQMFVQYSTYKHLD